MNKETALIRNGHLETHLPCSRPACLPSGCACTHAHTHVHSLTHSLTGELLQLFLIKPVHVLVLAEKPRIRHLLHATNPFPLIATASSARGCFSAAAANAVVRNRGCLITTPAALKAGALALARPSYLIVRERRRCRESASSFPWEYVKSMRVRKAWVLIRLVLRAG